MLSEARSLGCVSDRRPALRIALYLGVEVEKEIVLRGPTGHAAHMRKKVLSCGLARLGSATAHALLGNHLHLGDLNRRACARGGTRGGISLPLVWTRRR
jgi:hypothetical protein